MKSQKSQILKVGVTGGIGSGKSTVCKMFESLGIPVLYADDLAKEISNSKAGVKSALVKLLGDSAYNADGTLNREFVASRIFSQKKLQEKVNAIVHPEVEKEIDRRADDLQAHGSKIVVVEAALIYEAGLEKKLDVVVVVDAEENIRVDRLLSRGVEEADIRKRMKAQWNPGAKLKKADYILHNNHSIQELEQKIKFLHAVFQSL